MMARKTILWLLAAGGLAGSICAAAQPEPVGKIARTQGWAVVSLGTQYVTAAEGMPLREGDRLIVLQDSEVTILFKDGCRLTLSENELLTVRELSTCAAEAVGQYSIDPSTGVATTADPQAHLLPAGLEPPTPPPPPPPLAVIPATGPNWAIPATLIGAAAGVILLTRDDDGGPPPPISR